MINHSKNFELVCKAASASVNMFWGREKKKIPKIERILAVLKKQLQNENGRLFASLGTLFK